MRPAYPFGYQKPGNPRPDHPTWGERHQQKVICNRCGGPHEPPQCRANSKQVSDFNKIKNGIKPSVPEVTFNLPPGYGPGTTTQNVSSLYMYDDVDDCNWSLQHMEDDCEYGTLRFDDGMTWS